MSVFLWYSKGSQETGAWLADKLNITEHGTKPPREFAGSIVCWGAAPSEKFRWERRNFQAVFNDPRVIRPLLDRELLFKNISEMGFPTLKFINLQQPAPVVAEVEEAVNAPKVEVGKKKATPKEAPVAPELVVPTYAALCTALGVPQATGFIACTANGFKRVPVTSQETLATAVTAERTCVTTLQFGEKERIRVYVAHGMVAGASKYVTTMPLDTMAANVATSVTSDWNEFTHAQCTAILKKAIDAKLIVATGGTWVPHSIVDANIRNQVLSIATSMKFDFCAVDFAADGSGTIINIITTPNLREVTTVQSAITNAVSSWIYKNTRTAKDILLEVISGSTSEEASSLLEELSSLKGTVKLALKKEGQAADKQSAGGADSAPAKSKQ